MVQSVELRTEFNVYQNISHSFLSKFYKLEKVQKIGLIVL